MRVTYNISERDFMAAYETFWISRKQGRRTHLIWGGGGLLLGLIVVVTGNLIGWFVVMAGLLLLGVVPLRAFLHRRAYQENPKYSGSMTVDFAEDGIETSTPIGDSRLQWSFFSEALESDDSFLLLFTKRSFSIVPKRSFESGADFDSFRLLLESKIGEVKRI